jgi:hypothetical protein
MERKPVHRFDVRCQGGRKIADLNEPELECLTNSPTRECLIKTSCSPILRVVMRATPYNAKKKGVCFLKECDIDPDLGRWNPNWEKKFTGSIKLVQAGAPKLRVPAEKLDPRYKKKPNAKHFGVWHNLSKIRPSHAGT